MSLRDLREILQKSPVKQQIVWLDCCFAGELLNFKDTELGQHSSRCDRFLIAASRDYEVAYEQLNGEYGVLTGALLNGLEPYQVPEYEWITDRTLVVSVQHQWQDYYGQTKIPQSPLISNHGEKINLVQGRKQQESENSKLGNEYQLCRDTKHTINRSDVLAKLAKEGISPRPKRTEAEILTAFKQASSIGQNWLRTIDGKPIPRSELPKLIELIEQGN